MTDCPDNLSQAEKSRQQFDRVPFPHIPLEISPRGDYSYLFIHSLITPYYLWHRRVVDTQGKRILDVGCGSGYKALALVEANPGASVVGIDISQSSIEIAKQRFAYQGITNCEFHCLPVEKLPVLEQQFDYINCDEVLYLLPDPTGALQAMKAVLKPEGIIRGNLHHAYQRAPLYRAQELFRLMGLMEQSPTEFEEGVVIETLAALKSQVKVKDKKLVEEPDPEQRREGIGANYLLHGDRGFTISDLFSMLEDTNLEFISMVNWQQWDVAELFKDPNHLPEFWQISLAGASVQEILRVYELLHPVHRLMDFWCTHPGQPGVTVNDWPEQDWHNAVVRLHPQLQSDEIYQDLVACIYNHRAFEISKAIPGVAKAPVLLDPDLASCLIPLWDSAQPIAVLAERYHKVHPVDPITLQEFSYEQALTTIKSLVRQLDTFLYVLLERQ
jgi:2-polyprenyl-3-methyl-5-hydroxy-6-metoxy-1,4-benzoquinol methylase/uncharacterized protein Usg